MMRKVVITTLALMFSFCCFAQDFITPAIDVTVYRKCGVLVADKDTFTFVTVRLVSSTEPKAGVKIDILDGVDKVLKSYSFPKSYLYVLREKKMVTVGVGDITLEAVIVIPEPKDQADRVMQEIFYGEYRWVGAISERGLD